MNKNNEPWNKEEIKILNKLKSPFKIQEFLDNTPYSTDPFYRSPRSVMRDRKAHCVDGALFAAAALRYLGEKPLILEMKAVRDDDHFIALFKKNNHFGSVAKSNVVGLRYREPIYRNIRELVLSYFEFYYNLDGEKTLRKYTALMDLCRCDKLNWMTEDGKLEVIVENKMDSMRHFPIITEEMIKNLSPMDKRTYEAGLLGSDEAGLYKPGEH